MKGTLSYIRPVQALKSSERKSSCLSVGRRKEVIGVNKNGS